MSKHSKSGKQGESVAVTNEDKPLAAEQRQTKTKAYRMETLHRRQIRGVDYNPRNITEAARVLLKRNLEDVGQVAPISVNLRTEGKGWKPEACGYYILSGHQRLSIVDAIEGTDDYTIEVAVVELDPDREVAQNIFMNNTQAQGVFDLEMTEALLTGLVQSGTNLMDAGFSHEVTVQLFPENATLTGLLPDEALAPIPDAARAAIARKGVAGGALSGAPGGDSGAAAGVDGAKGAEGDGTARKGRPKGAAGVPPAATTEPAHGVPSVADAVQGLEDKYKQKMVQKKAEANSDDFVVFVFRDHTHCQEFRALVGAPEGERYFSAEQLLGWVKRASRKA